ncbi:hypothetical protein ABIC99_001821 [Sphaerotilus sulfidivorans]|uniref:Uncharacterized protein n=1 Tax=Sphaerotilus sulfidivorans TaxID=639200 RepID=A0A5C1PVN4_9BURK|nr:hypothetical protein [Sphaerotilus sulfidivorans]NZD45015.1 hypothetical protein [Sphaerotilus sulfidivorans]QEM99664.1 hypothetical protein EWH46_01995 [Sphaerotilus sulfidivorans]
MTHTIRLSILAASMVLLSACAPLQQAPLLYSSKMSVGLDLSMATSETPGGSIAIGYKNVDAAYVPVAVSKDAINKKGDIQQSYEIMRIEAIYGEGSTSAKINQQTAERKEDIKKYLIAKESELGQAAVVAKINAEISELNTKISTIRAAQRASRDAVVAAAEAALAAPGAAQPPNIVDTYDNDISKINADIKKAEGDLKVQQDKLATMQTESETLFQKAAEAANLLRTDKRDAMSVYGRFNSRGGGEINGSNAKANLTAGKIFSTGVASQNLTEAAKLEAAQSGVTECINKVSELLGPAPAKPDDAKIEAWRTSTTTLLNNLCKQPENKQSGKN